MREALTRRVDPWQAAAAQLRMEGEIAPGDLRRVPEQARPVQPLQVRMDFTRPGREPVTGKKVPGGATVRVRTRVTGRFVGTCQRCLEPVEFPLSVDAEVEVAAHESATAGDDAGETMVVLPGDLLDVIGLVEDEVLLALPFAPAHESGGCEQMPMPQPAPEEDEAAQDDARENPFAVLSRLKSGAEEC